MTPSKAPTRCAFVVCRIERGGDTYVVLVQDDSWGDLTLIGGHEEAEDESDLDRTARREALEELGATQAVRNSSLVPLSEEIYFGPTWSKSAKKLKDYIFKFYFVQFNQVPCLKEGRNESGVVLKFVKDDQLREISNLSNVVKLLLSKYQGELSRLPVSWREREHDRIKRKS